MISNNNNLLPIYVYKNIQKTNIHPMFRKHFSVIVLIPEGIHYTFFKLDNNIPIKVLNTTHNKYLNILFYNHARIFFCSLHRRTNIM